MHKHVVIVFGKPVLGHRSTMVTLQNHSGIPTVPQVSRTEPGHTLSRLLSKAPSGAISDRARDRARGAVSLRVWVTDYSTDVIDNQRWKGRRVIKNAPDLA
jgi:hypothetical protein